MMIVDELRRLADCLPKDLCAEFDGKELSIVGSTGDDDTSLITWRGRRENPDLFFAIWDLLGGDFHVEYNIHGWATTGFMRAVKVKESSTRTEAFCRAYLEIHGKPSNFSVAQSP